MAASEIDGARDFNLRMAQLQADTNLKTCKHARSRRIVGWVRPA